MTVKPEDDGYEIPVHLLDADDVPELTEDFFRNARPARELFAGLWGEAYYRTARLSVLR